MNSFFSGTDDANENMTQFYAVWGKVTSDEPQFSFRYVVGDTKQECSPSMLIDWPTVERTRTTIIQETVSLSGDLSMIDINLKDSTFTQEKEPEIEEFEPELVKGPFVRVEYPADWMTQHSKRTYTPRKNSYFGGNQYYEYKKKEFGGNYNQTSLDLGDDSFGSEDAAYPYGRNYSEYDRYLNEYYGQQTDEDYLEDEDIVMYSHNGEGPSESLTIFLEEVVFDLVKDKDTIKKFIY